MKASSVEKLNPLGIEVRAARSIYPHFDDREEIIDIDMLFRDFIIDVSVTSSHIETTVDAFRLLYEAVASLHHLITRGEFVIDTHEGLAFFGNKKDHDSIEYSIEAESGVHRNFTMSRAQAILGISLLVSETCRPIEASGEDVYGYLVRFPPRFF